MAVKVKCCSADSFKWEKGVSQTKDIKETAHVYLLANKKYYFTGQNTLHKCVGISFC